MCLRFFYLHIIKEVGDTAIGIRGEYLFESALTHRKMLCYLADREVSADILLHKFRNFLGSLGQTLVVHRGNKSRSD